MFDHWHIIYTFCQIDDKLSLIHTCKNLHKFKPYIISEISNINNFSITEEYIRAICRYPLIFRYVKDKIQPNKVYCDYRYNPDRFYMGQLEILVIETFKYGHYNIAKYLLHEKKSRIFGPVRYKETTTTLFGNVISNCITYLFESIALDMYSMKTIKESSEFDRLKLYIRMINYFREEAHYMFHNEIREINRNLESLGAKELTIAEKIE